MKPQAKNSFVELFASVQLALFLLFLLSVTAIIGTVIPQNSPPGFYVEQYGPRTADFFFLLDIQDMYTSWWFLGLLTLFAINLIVCSLDRLPRVLQTIRRDVLALAEGQLDKLPLQDKALWACTPQAAAELSANFLTGKGWQLARRDQGDQSLLCAHRGRWSRLGVYVVHLSILMILAGALIGSPMVAQQILKNPLFAFKGAIMLPELESSDYIMSQQGGQRLDLGFTLHCDSFDIAYYPNGMPKTYRSVVTILEAGQPVLTRAIEVNEPLTYKGVTLYQSSYRAFQNYIVTIRKEGAEATYNEVVAPARQVNWSEGGLSYGILNREGQGEVTRRVKFWFSDGQSEPQNFWLDNNQERLIKRPSGNYIVKVRQLYATGLQATKDPGVPLVYLGCLLMLGGLYVAFFLSHRRIYVRIRGQKRGCQVLFSAEANKNVAGLQARFEDYCSTLNEMQATLSSPDSNQA